MLDQILQGKSRINLDGLDHLMPEIPELPETLVRRMGILGRPHPADQAHKERLISQYHGLIEAIYQDKTVTALAVSGTNVVTKGVLAIERMVDRLPDGSRAQQLGQKLTEVHTQLLAQGHVANVQHFMQNSLKSRIS